LQVVPTKLLYFGRKTEGRDSIIMI